MEFIDYNENRLADEIDTFLMLAARKIADHSSASEFMDWGRKYIMIICPLLLSEIDDVRAQNAMCLDLTRAVWNATPQPVNNYRIKQIRKPQRNQPCDCGSGQKYKRCCGHFAGEMEMPIVPMIMTEKLLACLTAKELQSLALKHMNLEIIAEVARKWISEGNSKRAQSLLEPVFKDSDLLDSRSLAAFDVLIDCYDFNHHPLKKKRLIELALLEGSVELRSTALQRQATILADSGDYSKAWKLFQQAQRLTPDDPFLSNLEVLLLVNQDKADLAKERAKYWIARFKRFKDPFYDQFIDFLEEFISDPQQTMLGISTLQSPHIAQIKSLLETLPSVDEYDVAYKINLMPDDAGVIQPSAELLDLETQWATIYQEPAAIEPDYIGDWQDTDAWIEFLKCNHMAFYSFQVIEDISFWLQNHIDAQSPWFEDQLIYPLARRSAAMLDQLLDRVGPVSLPWGYLEHRPVLRQIHILTDIEFNKGQYQSAQDWLERVVYQLNPHDNQGLRAELMKLYLHTGQFQQAVTLAGHYPDDILVDIGFGQVLALYCSNQKGKAINKLQLLIKDSPLISQYLLKKNPAKPQLSEFGVTVGGKDEAWLYRERYYELWHKHDALGWLKSAVASIPTKSGRN